MRSSFEDSADCCQGLVELILDLISTSLIASLGGLVQLLSCSDLEIASLILLAGKVSLIEGLGQILNEFLSNLWQLLLSMLKNIVEAFPCLLSDFVANSLSGKGSIMFIKFSS